MTSLMDWDPLAPSQSGGAVSATELQLAAASVYASPAGRLLLDHLADQTIHRALPGSASADELRHLEGQRALVIKLKNMIVKGQSNV